MTFQDLFYVIIGVILGVSFMLVGTGLNNKERLSFWIGIIGCIIGIYLFLTA